VGDSEAVALALLQPVQSLSADVFQANPAYWPVGSLLFANLQSIARVAQMAPHLVQIESLVNLLFAVCGIVGIAHSEAQKIEDEFVLNMIGEAIVFGDVLLEEFHQQVWSELEAFAPVVSALCGQLIGPFLDLILMSQDVFSDPACTLAYGSHLMAMIATCRTMATDVVPDEALRQLLACIFVVLPGTSDCDDGFPSEACLQSLFHTRIARAAYPRMVGRKLFGQVFLREDRLPFVVDAFMSIEPISEGILFLLEAVGRRFGADAAVSAAAVQVLGRFLEPASRLPVWTVDVLSFLRTASLFFASLPDEAKAFVQVQSELLMAECCPASAHCDTVGFTVGVEVLSRILRAGGAATERQAELLLHFGTQTIGNIGLEVVAMVFPERANAIVADATAQLHAYLRSLHGSGRGDADSQAEFERRALFLASQIPFVGELDLRLVAQLVPLLPGFSRRVDLSIDTEVLTRVLAAAVPIGKRKFGEWLVDSLFKGEARFWRSMEPGLSSIVLNFVCAHRALPPRAADVAARLFEADWSEMRDFELGVMIDLMCAYVHLGVSDNSLIQGVLGRIETVDHSVPEFLHAIIRWHATLFLAGIAPLPEGCGATWVTQVTAGWFSTAYLSQLTILCFSRLVGDGNEALIGCIEGLQSGTFPGVPMSEDPDEIRLWTQPAGLATLLDRYREQ
jgi:hypothetical protein